VCRDWLFLASRKEGNSLEDKNKNWLKEIDGSLTAIAMILFFMVLVQTCSGPSMSETNKKLDDISSQLKKIADKK
jgi:hypothetical protein